MKTTNKPISSGGEVLGNLDFPIYDDLDEMKGTYGEQAVHKLAQRALTIDVERIARDNLKQGKDEAEVQAMIEAYKPGGSRTAKPTLKNLMGRLQALSTKVTDDPEAMEIFQEAGKIYNADGVEAAINYLDEQGY